MDDAWGENMASHQSKNHTEHDIRRAFWKATIAGGVGGLLRGGGTGGCYNGFLCINHLEEEWESEKIVQRAIEYPTIQSVKLFYPGKSYAVALIFAKLLELHFNEDFYTALDDPMLLLGNDPVIANRAAIPQKRSL